MMPIIACFQSPDFFFTTDLKLTPAEVIGDFAGRSRQAAGMAMTKGRPFLSTNLTCRQQFVFLEFRAVYA
jgi:hypothetical protein